MRHILQSLFGLELSTAQKVIVASVVILVLLALLGLFVRQIQGGRLRVKGHGGGRTRQPRLGVVDAHNLDRQRQLILIRRDNVEHLIMVGGPSDVVVETNIVRSGARAAAQPIDYAGSERPQAFDGLLAPELARQDAPRQELARQEAVRQEPIAVAQPRPDLPPAPPVRPVQAEVQPRPAQSQTQLDAALVAAAAAPVVLAAAASSATPRADVAPTPTVQPPSFARDHAPSPAASAVELDSMARQLEEALKRPFSAVRPANSPGEPQAAARPAAIPDVAPVEPDPIEPVLVATPAPEVVHPAPVEAVSRPSSLPADVEAELEMALGLRPERTVSPPAAAPAAAEPEPVSVAPIEPMIAEITEDLTVQDEAEDLVAPPREEAETDASSEPAAESERPIEPAEPAGEVEIAPPQKVEAEQKPAAIDPFSVDAIEAEFARLLGRDPNAKS